MLFISTERIVCNCKMHSYNRMFCWLCNSEIRYCSIVATFEVEGRRCSMKTSIFVMYLQCILLLMFIYQLCMLNETYYNSFKSLIKKEKYFTLRYKINKLLKVI